MYTTPQAILIVALLVLAGFGVRHLWNKWRGK
jgi:hypothetical protein